MIKINGVKARNNFELKKQNIIKPTIKEILDRMENNYQNINNVDSQNFNYNKEIKNQNESAKSNTNVLNSLSNMFNPNKNTYTPSENIGGDNLILSILPMLLSKNKNTNSLKNTENLIFKEILKNSNNPKLMQLAELLPKILNKKSIETETTEQEVKDIPNIESYTKTTEFLE